MENGYILTYYSSFVAFSSCLLKLPVILPLHLQFLVHYLENKKYMYFGNYGIVTVIQGSLIAAHFT